MWLLYKLLALLDILDTKLEGRVAAVVVLDDRVADVEGIACLDIIVIIRHVECDGRNLMEGLFLIDQVKLHVDTAGTDLTAVATVRNVLCQEYGIIIAGTEGLELL